MSNWKEDPIILEWFEEIRNLTRNGPGSMVIDPSSPGYGERAVLKETVRSYLRLAHEASRLRKLYENALQNFALASERAAKSNQRCSGKGRYPESPQNRSINVLDRESGVKIPDRRHGKTTSTTSARSCGRRFRSPRRLTISIMSSRSKKRFGESKNG